MTYFCLSLRLNGVGGLVSGNFTEIKAADLEVVTPLTTIGPGYEIQGRPGVTLDALIGQLPSSATIVVWNAHSWFHRIGPSAARAYPNLVDLFALFVSQRSHCVSLAAFDCMAGIDPLSAAAVVALLKCINDKGRLTWKSYSGQPSAFWTPNFLTPLRDLQQKTPPRWVTSPERIELHGRLL